MHLHSFLSTLLCLSSLSGHVAAEATERLGQPGNQLVHQPTDQAGHQPTNQLALQPTDQLALQPADHPGEKPKYQPKNHPNDDTGGTIYRASRTPPLGSGFGAITRRDRDEETIMGKNLQEVVRRGTLEFARSRKNRKRRWYVYHINATDPMIQWGLERLNNPNHASWTDLAKLAPMGWKAVKGWDTYWGEGYSTRYEGWTPNRDKYNPNDWVDRQVDVVSRKIYRPAVQTPAFYSQRGAITADHARFEPVMFGGDADKRQLINIMGNKYPYTRWYLYRLEWTPEYKSKLAEVPRMVRDLSEQQLEAEFPMPFSAVTHWEEFIGTKRQRSSGNSENNLKRYGS